MEAFETVLALLMGATLLSAVAKRICIPYPTLLAIGGALITLLPGAPSLEVPPTLIMCLFVAPVLVDAAHDASLRDLRHNWTPILSLVLGAVALTTVAVAVAARMLFPDFPWPAAIVLGALLAPPDAVAALAVLGQLNPPHRIRVILEGESLLNDASALLIYKLALGATALGSLSITSIVPSLGFVVLGGMALGWLASWPAAWITGRCDDAPSLVIFQFVLTFALWLLAEHLGVSGVMTLVVFALTMARRHSHRMPARQRIPSFAIWETVTLVLNVLAFTLIGLQLRPILGPLDAATRNRYLVAGLVIFLCVVIVRIAWVFAHHLFVTTRNRLAQPENHDANRPTAKHALLVGWAGMRGIVTLAAAMALPPQFPYRDFIELTAFIVVLGSLVVQGMTLRPLLGWFRLPHDSILAAELQAGRQQALQAALAVIEQTKPQAECLKREYTEALSRTREGLDPRDTADNALRLTAITAARKALDALRHTGVIGDDAYRQIENELDWREMSCAPGDSSSS
ncbi:MAG TPA: cation:proton antiporter [Candidatus Sulfotelmatobacter sp.]|jgi:CPA1 family monovalent cation:H+ antiporter|nr:cation:proton antiporter [Candidatus Sulfotelmatobacter sp.]